MEWVIMSVCAVIVLLCGIGSVLTEREKTEGQDAAQPRKGGVSDAREAHYMANFWSYDGSLQQDWDE